MLRPIQRLKDVVVTPLALHTLSKPFFNLALVQVLANSVVVMQGLYLSTLLLRVTGDSNLVLYYNVVYYIFGAVGLFPAVVMVRRRPAVYCLRAAAFLYVSTYVILLAFMQQIGFLWWLSAALAGSGAGFEYLGYTMLLLDVTNNENRDKALSMMSLLYGFNSLLLPVLAGAMITALYSWTGNELIGYIVLYSVCTLLLCAMLFCTLRLPKPMPVNRACYFRGVFRDLISHRSLRLALWMDTISGLRDGTFGFFLNLLLFELIENEFVLGLKTFGCGVASIFAAYMAGRLLRPERRIKSMLWSTSVMLLPVLLLYFDLSPWTVILVSLASSLTTIFITTPMTAMTLAVMQRMPDSQKKNPECITIRTCFVASGRLIGIFLVRSLTDTAIGCVTALALIVASQYLLGFFGRWMERRLEQEEPAPVPVHA